jgi:hypothetical protein
MLNLIDNLVFVVAIEKVYLVSDNEKIAKSISSSSNNNKVACISWKFDWIDCLFSCVSVVADGAAAVTRSQRGLSEGEKMHKPKR